MARLVSGIYEKGPSAYSDDRRKQELAEGSIRAWRERGIAVIEVDALLDDWERQMITNLANRLYGERRG
jgi:hypothetical protein